MSAAPTILWNQNYQNFLWWVYILIIYNIYTEYSYILYIYRERERERERVDWPKIREWLKVTTLVPANKHGDASPEYIESCSLLLHQHAASPAKRSTWVSHVLAAEAWAFLTHHCRCCRLSFFFFFWLFLWEMERVLFYWGFLIVWWIWEELGGVYGFYISGFNYWLRIIYLKIPLYHLYFILLLFLRLRSVW